MRAVACVLACCGLLAACTSTHTDAPQPGPVVQSFVSAWSHGDYSAMRRLVHKPSASFTSTYTTMMRELGASSALVTAGALTQHGHSASAPVTEQIALAHIGRIVLHSRLHLALHGTHWLVTWTPATIDPALRAGDRFVVTPSWGPRGSILGAGGITLTSGAATVTIGVQGSFIKNATTLSAALVAAGATSQEVTTAIASARASPSAFIPVITVSQSRYEQLKPQIYPVPGTVFRSNGATTASPGLAAVVGTLGTPSKTELKALGPPYTAASIVGTSGIEQTEERRLAGTPGATVTLTDPSGKVIATLATLRPLRGRNVTTSIDPSIQAAAENALSGLGYQAALVAINASTDQVVAAVNTPALGTTDLALDGEQPPGSTFKVITSTALIERGLTPQSPASCPPVVNVDGENLHNAGGELPVSNMIQAFTESCNTAFIQLTMANLGYSSLHQAAAGYDLGVTPRLGAPAFGGSVPVATGQTDLAASAIGQAEIIVSPLDLASVAAAVDSGTVREPRLVAGAPDDTAPTHKLPSDLVTYEHEMMASVVASGTAAGTGLPPGTYAKTGTAEYGTGPTLPIDAWLMGFDGNIAFAMCTINSPKEGGPMDGPYVAKFLDAINTKG